MAIDCDVGFESSSWGSRGSYMVGSVCDCKGVLFFFLCVIGTAGFATFFHSAGSSIASLMVSSVVLGSFLLIVIARVVSSLSTVVA